MEKSLTSIEEIVAPTHTCIAVIDMQNDFCSQEGAFARQGQQVHYVRQIVPSLHDFIERSRLAKVRIVFVRVVFRPQDFSGPMIERYQRLNMTRCCLENTWGSDFYPPLLPGNKDGIVIKRRFSAFYSETFRPFLEANGIRTLVLTGCLTNVCVESTARQAYMENYYVVVPSDCVASYSLEMHEAALNNVERFFGRVSTSKELSEIWTRPAAQPD